MSGPNPPGSDSSGQEPSNQARHARPEDELDHGPPEDEPAEESTGHTDAYSRAYSAPESEQFTSGPYVPADPALYDYDEYEPATELVERASPPRWPWVVGITAILAAIALVASVLMLVTRTESNNLATPATTTSKAPPPQTTTTETPSPQTTTTEVPPPPPPPTETTTTTESSTPSPTPSTTPSPSTTTTTTPPPPPPPPPTTTTPAGPRQVTYTVTGTKAPGDIISITYVDASGRQRTQRNVYIPWSLTVTPISTSDIGSVQASSFFRVSRLNCSITTSDGQVLSSNNGDAPQTSC
jgi:Mycobacterium membrane protein